MTELISKLAGRRVVASISGGKDSAAMSLLLTEKGIEHERVFCDTGWEHPQTYDYLRGPLTDAIGHIHEIRATIILTTEERIRIEHAIADLPLVLAQYVAGAPMVLAVLKKAVFPGGKTRWCTELLKEEPIKLYLEQYLDGGEEIVDAVGIRAAESETRATYSEWKDLRWGRIRDRRHVQYEGEMWHPILRWSISDVVAIHERHGLRPNPLYLIPGIERVGCGPCIRSRKSEIRATADRMPERIDLLRELEFAVGRLAAQRLDGQEIRNPNWRTPAWFQAPTGDSGACWPIDKVVEWSRTSRGGRQFELFAPTESAGCLRWGLCDTGSTK